MHISFYIILYCRTLFNIIIYKPMESFMILWNPTYIYIYIYITTIRQNWSP